MFNPHSLTRTRMKTLLTSRLPLAALLAVSGLISVPAPAWAEDGDRLAAQPCSACHGMHGYSKSPLFPRLIAQTPEYLVAQLKGFREHARGETDARSYMWAIASQLDDATIQSLAEYFSHQEAIPGAAGDAALLANGQEIFERGVPDKGVPACASCHGPQAQGAGTFPRLA